MAPVASSQISGLIAAGGRLRRRAPCGTVGGRRALVRIVGDLYGNMSRVVERMNWRFEVTYPVVVRMNCRPEMGYPVVVRMNWRLEMYYHVAARMDCHL